MSVNQVVNGELKRIAGGTLWADSPVGVIQPFGGSAIPSGWLLCNGAEVLKTDYAELYAVIGDAFGTASVNTKFVLPDLREATTKGAGLTGHTVGAHVKSGGLAVGEFIDDQYESHAHYIKDSAVGGLTGYGMDSGQAAGVTDRTTTGTGNRLWIASGNYKTGVGSIDSRDGATTEVKSVGVNYIIKAVQVALPADLASGVEEYLSWKMFSSDLGNDWVDLPTTYNELHVAIYSATWNGGNDIVIADKSNKIHCLTAYINATNYIYGLVQIQNNQIKKGMNGGVFGGSSVSDVKVTVRYR